MKTTQRVWQENIPYRQSRCQQLQVAASDWRDSSWRGATAAVATLTDLHAPASALPTDAPVVDCVASVLKHSSGRTIALMSRNRNPNQLIEHSVGKSSTAAALLGLRIGSVARGLPTIDYTPTAFELISSDMGYWFAAEGGLYFTPTMGEAAVFFAWDLVRLLSRKTGFKSDDMKFEVFRGLPSICHFTADDLLTTRQSPHRITDIFLFDESERLDPPAEARLEAVVEPDKRDALASALCNALRQKSGFWRRSPEPHHQAADEIVEELSDIPNVWALQRQPKKTSVEGSIQSRVRCITSALRRRACTDVTGIGRR